MEGRVLKYPDLFGIDIDIDFLSQSNVKNHDFIKKSLQFSIFLEHPLVYVKQIWVF